MAQRTIIQLVDDLDGSEIVDGDGETVSFGLDGQQYTIDLNRGNAERLRGFLQEYVAAATRVTASRSRGAKRPTGPSAAEIRAWALDQGIEVPSRGRIPREVQEQYEAVQ